MVHSERLESVCAKALVGSNPSASANMIKVSHDSETSAQGQQVFTAAAFIHSSFDGVNKVFYLEEQRQRNSFQIYLSCQGVT